MDRNLLLAFALSMAVFSGWLAWQQSMVVPEREAAAERAEAARAAAPALETPKPPETPTVGEIPLPPEPAKLAADKAPVEETASAILSGSDDTSTSLALWEGDLESTTVAARFSNQGAALVGWKLKDFYETPKHQELVQLIDLPPGLPPTLSTPFRELDLGDLSAMRWEVESADEQEIVFVIRRGGVTLRKTYRGLSDDYTLELIVEVINGSGRSLQPAFQVVIPAATNDRPDFGELSLIALVGDDVTSELVSGVGSPGFFSRFFGGGQEGPVQFSSNLVYAGLEMRYFAGVLLPESTVEAGGTLVPLTKGESAAAVVSLAGIQVDPGTQVSRQFTAFIGPKQTSVLDPLGEEVRHAIMRGDSWVAPLTTFFEWALARVHDVVPNYGLAIIVLTILVRLATWPIMVRQMKSAERMRELMPRIKALQEKFKDDRQKQSEETFKLYRETGVNPLGGCLPMVLQLPVFIGLFYALQSSIDLRQAPFFLWINDLSAPATLFTLPGVDFPVRILPILMGASMLIQQKMMPQAGMDPAQAKMMLIMMPGMMLVISYTFPSGLVLYWMVSNVLGIAHQLYVRRKMHTES